MYPVGVTSDLRERYFRFSGFEDATPTGFNLKATAEIESYKDAPPNGVGERAHSGRGIQILAEPMTTTGTLNCPSDMLFLHLQAP